jgi:ATP-binding protein involved in chromosome partitioning
MRLGLPFLGEVPLDIDVRVRSDMGEPIVAAHPEGPHAAIFSSIADAVWSQIDAGTRRKSPRIVIED